MPSKNNIKKAVKTSKLEVRIIRSREEFSSLQDDWTTLLASVDNGTPFLSWSWMYSWWEIYATSAHKLRIITIWKEKKLVALAPFMYQCASVFPRLQELRFIGTGELESEEVCPEYLDALIHKDYIETSLDLMLEHIALLMKKSSKTILDSLLCTGSLAKALPPYLQNNGFKFKRYDIGRRYFVELPKDWNQYLNEILSKSQRQKTRRVLNKFERNSDLTISVVKDKQEVESIYQHLISLHSKRWSRTNKPGAFSSKKFVDFHFKQIVVSFSKNELQLIKLCNKDEVIGVLYNFKYGSTIYFYQCGFDLENWSDISPGSLMHMWAIRQNIEDTDVSKYDFMMGDANSSYKKKFGCNNTGMINLLFNTPGYLNALKLFAHKLF